MRIEASNLQSAFEEAAKKLNCSVTQLDITIIQHPSTGFFGFFKKNAIIEASVEVKKQNCEKRNQKLEKKQSEKIDQNSEKSRNKNRKKPHQNLAKQSLSEKNDTLSQSAFGDKQNDTTNELKPEYVIKRLNTPENLPQRHEKKDILDTSIIDNFNTDEIDKKTNVKAQKSKVEIKFDEILPIIKSDLKRLLDSSCFSISKIEVSKFNDECVFIELDGEDAALLIGKEGYRYKAISYLLHNWLSVKYNLSIRLEIAEFLKNQEEMIEQYLAVIVERVQANGKAQTKPLDGVLVKIALEKLRAKFPEKYVGIKSNGNDKFVVINEFFKK